jgi:4-cresol dehydrogenase (hydroxylating)
VPSFPTPIGAQAGNDVHSPDLVAALSAWRARLGDEAVLVGAAAAQRYGSGTIGIRRSVPATLRPRCVDDIVAIVAIARTHGVALYPISTGHNWGYGDAYPVVEGCVVVDLSALDRIIDLDAELGLVTIQPGVTQQKLRDFLDRRGLAFLVPTTGAGPHCSILGNALERGYGITPCTDHFAAVTALEAVLPNGRIYRSAMRDLGGEVVDRAFKWGTGPYLDGLFAQGNLGIVTQMTIALAPRPERVEAFFFSVSRDAELAAAVLAIRQILRELPGVTGAINLMNARRVLAMIETYPHTRVDDTGTLPASVIAELAGNNRVSSWTGVGTLYGTSDIVKAARRPIRRLLKPVADRISFITPGSASALNRLLQRLPHLRHGRAAKRAHALDRSLRLIAGEPSTVALPLAYWKSPPGSLPQGGSGDKLDPARDGCGLIWYPPLVPMQPASVARYVELVGGICPSYGIEPLITLTSLSDRCFDSSVPLLFDRQDAAQTRCAQACYRALFEAGRREGFLPYRAGIHAMEHVVRPGTPFWDMVAAIKSALDPEEIIAPGRYAPITNPGGVPDVGCDRQLQPPPAEAAEFGLERKGAMMPL